MRHALAEVLDTKEVQGLLNTVSDGGLVEPEVGRAERNILLHGGGEDLVVGVLEDDPHELPDFPDVLLRDRLTPDQHLAGCGLEYAVEVFEEGALPGPVRPDDCDT